jgi:hypothetical protein
VSHSLRIAGNGHYEENATWQDPPFVFDSSSGTARKVEPIVREVRGAKARGLPASHIIVIGPSGVGKSPLVRELAAEYGTNVVTFIAAVTVKESLDALAKMKTGDFLHLDEARALPSDGRRSGRAGRNGASAPPKRPASWREAVTWERNNLPAVNERGTTSSLIRFCPATDLPVADFKRTLPDTYLRSPSDDAPARAPSADTNTTSK